MQKELHVLFHVYQATIFNLFIINLNYKVNMKQTFRICVYTFLRDLLGIWFVRHFLIEVRGQSSKKFLLYYKVLSSAIFLKNTRLLGRFAPIFKIIFFIVALSVSNFSLYNIKQ